MILNASGRCDICGYFMPWLMNRIKEGYADVRNPFYPHLVHRIPFEQVEGIVFCTKNPIPALGVLEKIPWPMLFHVTLTPYIENMEPCVPDKRLIIEAIHELSEKLGKDYVIVRYDPILISDQYTVSYHQMMFERMCSHLEGKVETIIISFLDLKKNTRINQKVYQYRKPSVEEIHEMCAAFSCSAKKHGMMIQTCAEEIDLSVYEIHNVPCFSEEIAYFLTGALKKRKRGQREECKCISTVDLGAYNLCLHGCRYCYANYDEKMIRHNMKLHDPTSSLICGHLQKDDEIRIRED
ncbi:MAG: DUF1848 domain-containing protein [Erysipelotrichaceae bacterium]|nr:DUF1848 domain-containing protein [Erysipelotrichaceae bacterium]